MLKHYRYFLLLICLFSLFIYQARRFDIPYQIRKMGLSDGYSRKIDSSIDNNFRERVGLNPAHRDTFAQVSKDYDVERRLFYTIPSKKEFGNKPFKVYKNWHYTDDSILFITYYNNEGYKENTFYVSKDSVYGPYILGQSSDPSPLGSSVLVLGMKCNPKNGTTLWKMKFRDKKEAYIIRCCGFNFEQNQEKNAYIIAAECRLPGRSEPGMYRDATYFKHYYLSNGDIIKSGRLQDEHSSFYNTTLFFEPKGKRIGKIVQSVGSLQNEYADIHELIDTYSFNDGTYIGRFVNSKIIYAEKANYYGIIHQRHKQSYLYFQGKDTEIRDYESVIIAKNGKGFLVQHHNYTKPSYWLSFEDGEVVDIEGQLLYAFWDDSKNCFAWFVYEKGNVTLSWKDKSKTLSWHIGKLPQKEKTLSATMERQKGETHAFFLLLATDKGDYYLLHKDSNQHYVFRPNFHYPPNAQYGNINYENYLKMIDKKEKNLPPVYPNPSSIYTTIPIPNTNRQYCEYARNYIEWDDGFIVKHLINPPVLHPKDSYLYWFSQEENRIYWNRRPLK